jgi:hypothetical protein
MLAHLPSCIRWAERRSGRQTDRRFRQTDRQTLQAMLAHLPSASQVYVVQQERDGPRHVGTDRHRRSRGRIPVQTALHAWQQSQSTKQTGGIARPMALMASHGVTCSWRHMATRRTRAQPRGQLLAEAGVQAARGNASRAGQPWREQRRVHGIRLSEERLRRRCQPRQVALAWRERETDRLFQ